MRKRRSARGLAIWSAERLKVPLGERSDSLVSMVFQDRSPRFNADETLGVVCWPFQPSAVLADEARAPGGSEGLAAQ